MRPINLPNVLSAGRIAAAPFLLVLPFIPSVPMRLVAFVLFVLAAVTDYWDGKVARVRNQVTDLGRVLDPLADKMLFLATIVPAYLLMRPRVHWFARLISVEPDPRAYPFELPWGEMSAPLWLVIVIVAREAAMTIFRSAAARRGVVIAAIPSAKWKTGLQQMWIGAALFWITTATAADVYGVTASWWPAAASFIGLVGVACMMGALVMALYSFAVYLRRYGDVFARQPAR